MAAKWFLMRFFIILNMHNDRPGTRFSLVFYTEVDLFFTRAAFIQGNVAYKKSSNQSINGGSAFE